MKIGVIGSHATVNVIRKVVERTRPDMQFIYRCSDYYEQSADAAKELQKTDIQGLLFSGPTNYNYSKKRVEQTVPWAYIPHNYATILQALMQAIVQYQCDLTRISVDVYEPELFRKALFQVGITDAHVAAPSLYSPEQENFEAQLLAFHKQCYENKTASVCFTNMEHIYQPLRDAGIPAIRISTVEDVVLEQIYRLQILNLSTQENHGRMAAVQIYFDYSFDDEHNLSIREWEKMKYQNQMKEQIFEIAQRMDAASFDEGGSHFHIFTTKNTLMNVFLKKGEHLKLLRYAQISPRYRIWIGMGIGNTPLEAKSRAAMALNHAIADQSGSYYLAESENQVTAPMEYVEPQNIDTYFAQKLHISDMSFLKLCEILKNYGESITSAELAKHLEITERSANRIIARLEKEGCVTMIGKRSEGKGRPARVMKIVLPFSYN